MTLECENARVRFGFGSVCLRLSIFKHVLCAPSVFRLFFVFIFHSEVKHFESQLNFCHVLEFGIFLVSYSLNCLWNENIKQLIEFSRGIFQSFRIFQLISHHIIRQLTNWKSQLFFIGSFFLSSFINVTWICDRINRRNSRDEIEEKSICEMCLLFISP